MINRRFFYPVRFQVFGAITRAFARLFPSSLPILFLFTIIADTCAFADGLATAIMVLGAEKGLDLISRLDEVEGLIIVEKMDGSLADFYSKGFKVLQ